MIYHTSVYVMGKLYHEERGLNKYSRWVVAAIKEVDFLAKIVDLNLLIS